MALSFNLGYQESISVHPTKRQNFAGKVYSNFPNIWEWLISYIVKIQIHHDVYCLNVLSWHLNIRNISYPLTLSTFRIITSWKKQSSLSNFQSSPSKVLSGWTDYLYCKIGSKRILYRKHLKEASRPGVTSPSLVNMHHISIITSNAGFIWNETHHHHHHHLLHNYRHPSISTKSITALDPSPLLQACHSMKKKFSVTLLCLIVIS